MLGPYELSRYGQPILTKERTRSRKLAKGPLRYSRQTTRHKISQKLVYFIDALNGDIRRPSIPKQTLPIFATVVSYVWTARLLVLH